MSKFKGKKVLIVGFGKSGVAVARYMGKQGAKISVTDIKQRAELSDSIKACADLRVEYQLGRHDETVFDQSDLIVVSPGVPLNIGPIERAREKGIQVTSEIELAASALQVPLIAVTGTNGKTTVSTLIGEMFKADGREAFVGGNIGKPLLDYVTDGHQADVVVAELSSFQLDLLKDLVPAVAVFTNIGEDHLDRYPDMEMYIEAKKKLLKACDKNTFVALNYDDPVVAQFANETNAKVMWFTKRDPMKIGSQFAEDFWGCYYNPEDRKIVAKLIGEEETFDAGHFQMIGDHNKENLMAAICAVRNMGVGTEAIKKVITEFKGIPHRLEFVRKKDGVYFFNDSKATNVASLSRSLCAFRRNPLIVIAGGRDKDSDFGKIRDIVSQKVKLLILVGESKERINRELGEAVETYLVGTFEEAIYMAYQKSRRNDIILLSPGCKSYDMFRNFEERGDYFKKLVIQF